MEIIWTLLVGLIVYILVVLHRHLTKYRGYLESLGIPIDPPGIWFGSGPLDMHNYKLFYVQVKQMKKYGLTYGHYDGILPVISTVDPELRKAIMVKHFDSFTDVFHIDVSLRRILT